LADGQRLRRRDAGDDLEGLGKLRIQRRRLKRRPA
jgi:hypothetical protein